MSRYVKQRKKSMALVDIIILVSIGLLVAVIITMWFSSSAKKSTGAINENLNGAGDKDGDLVLNFQDKCPCIKGDQNAKDSGCPAGTAPTATCPT